MRGLSQFHRAAAGLALLGGLVASGCLIDAPDPVTIPERAAPRVFVERAIPPTTSIVQTKIVDNETPTFTVPFVSDDLGEDVVGKLFLNFGLSGEKFVGVNTLTATTLEDTDREMGVAWGVNPNLAAGCYTMTMTITHRSNYEGDLLGPINLEKTALVTWIIVHNIEPQSVTLDECPVPTVPNVPNE